MYRRITTHPVPLGIVKTATAKGTATQQRAFFGHSYTALTPREYILQKLGLTITKAFALHLRNLFQKLGTHPNPNFTRPPPGFDPIPDPADNPDDLLEFIHDALS